MKDDVCDITFLKSDMISYCLLRWYFASFADRNITSWSEIDSGWEMLNLRWNLFQIAASEPQLLTKSYANMRYSDVYSFILPPAICPCRISTAYSYPILFPPKNVFLIMRPWNFENSIIYPPWLLWFLSGFPLESSVKHPSFGIQTPQPKFWLISRGHLQRFSQFSCLLKEKKMSQVISPSGTHLPNSLEL